MIWGEHIQEGGTYVKGELGSSAIICSAIEGVLWITLTLELNRPKEPVKLGRRCVRSDVRSWPKDRFFCSLGLSARGRSSLSRERCRPKGKVKVGPCGTGGGRTLAVVAEGGDDDAEAFSAFSLSCLNLLKYRSEANSVM